MHYHLKHNAFVGKEKCVPLKNAHFLYYFFYIMSWVLYP